MDTNQTLHLALQHHQAGQLIQAEALYRQILAQQPQCADALHLLGVLASQTGQHEQSAQLIRQAIEQNPAAATYHDNLGVALAAAEKRAEAVEAHRKAISLNPEFAEAHHHLANALGKEGQSDQAIVHHRRAIELRPGYAEAHYNLGVLFQALHRYEEAIGAYRAAVAVRADYGDAYNNMGACFYELGRLDESVAVYQQALALRPDLADAYNNMGNAYRAMGRFDEARQWFERIIRQSPQYPLAHWNLGLLLLARGDFARGWPEYEWRWRCKSFDLRDDLTQPRWNGGDLGGKRILLYAEQGHGDAIQFMRYVPMVAARGGEVVVVCHAELHRLFRCVGQVRQWAGLDEPLPKHDVQCPLMSLPAVFGTALNSIPAQVPYLQVDPILQRQWQGRLAAVRGRKVGLVWAGRPEHANDRNRSIPLAALGALAAVENLRLISLQKGPASEQLKTCAGGLTIADWTSELKDFADTAALMANLDLIITVDTSVAHLAGAIGKQVWMLLPFVPDWRWMLGRGDSPWYPTMRLFRQDRIGQWDGVVQQVLGALRSGH